MGSLTTYEPQCLGFWPYVIVHLDSGSNRLGRDQVAGESASSHSRAIAPSLLAKWSSVFHQMKQTAFMLYGMIFSCNHLMYFMLPKSISILLKIDLHDLQPFWGYFIRSLPIYHKFLEPNRCYTIKIQSILVIAGLALDMWLPQANL